MIYNLLLFKSYELAKKLENWEDAPLLFAIMWISVCFLCHLISLFFLLEGILDKTIFNEFGAYRYFIAAIACTLLYYYYSRNGRWKRIVLKYEARKKTNFLTRAHPIVIIGVYYVTSFAVLLVTALFKNEDWIFA